MNFSQLIGIDNKKTRRFVPLFPEIEQKWRREIVRLAPNHQKFGYIRYIKTTKMHLGCCVE